MILAISGIKDDRGILLMYSFLKSVIGILEKW